MHSKLNFVVGVLFRDSHLDIAKPTPLMMDFKIISSLMKNFFLFSENISGKYKMGVVIVRNSI